MNKYTTLTKEQALVEARKIKISGITVEEYLDAQAPKLDATKTKEFGGPCYNGECPICFDEWSDEDRIYQLPCKHCFHKQCFEKYREKKKGPMRCPFCDDPIYELKLFKNIKDAHETFEDAHETFEDAHETFEVKETGGATGPSPGRRRTGLKEQGRMPEREPEPEPEREREPEREPEPEPEREPEPEPDDGDSSGEENFYDVTAGIYKPKKPTKRKKPKQTKKRKPKPTKRKKKPKATKRKRK